MSTHGEKLTRVKGSIDYTLLITVLILVTCGLIMVFSASYYMAQSSALYDYDGLALFKKQLFGAGLGLIAMLFLMNVDYKKLMNLRVILYVFSIALLVAVLIPGVGTNINGSSRWLRVFGISIQPAEIAKVAMIILFASMIYHHRSKMGSFRYGLLPIFIVLIPICALLYFQPNYSAFLVFVALAFLMAFIGGAKGWQLLVLLVVGALALFVLMADETYRVKRVTSFLDPWANPTGDGYQVIQSLYGIGSGGIFGQGIGNGTQKLSWLPYSESDFIFSIIVEELGLVGAVLLLVLFAVLIYRGIKISAMAPDLFGTMVAAGIVVLIGLQVLINVGVVTSTIPPTGVALPFISYGGSSLIIFMAMIGILLNISKQGRRILTVNETVQRRPLPEGK